MCLLYVGYMYIDTIIYFRCPWRACCVKWAEYFIIKWYNFLLLESVSSILNEEEENFKLNMCACVCVWWCGEVCVGRQFKGNFWNILWDLIKMLLTLGRTSVAVCLCSAWGWRWSSCYVSWFESPGIVYGFICELKEWQGMIRRGRNRCQ